MKQVALLIAVLSLLALSLAEASTSRSLVPRHETITTKNGVQVFFFPNENIPLFEVHLVFGAGSDLDPEGLSGLGLFSASMARRGVPGLDENAISRRLDDLAGGIDFSVDEEHTSVSAFGLNLRSREILDLLFDELARPVFPQEPFDRMRANHIDSIAQLPDSASGLATYVIDSLIFNGTPKARPGSGFSRDVERITIDKVRDWYPRLVRTDRLKALVIGGSDRREVLERVIAGIERLPCTMCGKPEPQARAWDLATFRVQGGHALVVSRPGIPEAHVRMGFRGPKRTTPEFYDLRVAETILSGHFASRLNMVIREKLNLTYGIDASFFFGETSGSFVLSTSTRNEKVGELITQVNKLLRDFVDGQVSEQDLRIAKDYLEGSFPLGLQNMFVTSNSFFNGLLHGLEPDFLDRYQERIEAVTLDSLKTALRKYMPLSEMKTVIVGDPKAVGRELSSAKIKYVTRRAQEFL